MVNLPILPIEHTSMPVNSEQLAAGAAYTRETFAANEPIDQIGIARPTLAWLVAKKIPSIFGNGVFNEMIRVGYDSNYQRYTGDQQVGYNRRNPTRKAPFYHYEAHDGFSLNETELSDNGIIMTDDRNAVMTGAEKIQIVSKLKDGHWALKEGMQRELSMDLWRDGTHSPLAPPGIDALVSTTPSAGTIGGIPGSNAYWQNNVNLNIPTTTPGNLVAEMEETWRETTRYGGSLPDYIPCGKVFYDRYREDALDTINRQLNVSGRGGATVDASVSGVFFKGVPLVHDPVMDELETLLGPSTYPWTHRCYFLNSRFIHLRPVQGRWMIDRRPSRMYDRYTHYFATTTDYGTSISKRNAHAVLSVAV